MSGSNYSGKTKKNSRGFAFTLDAVIAIVLFAGFFAAIGLLTVQENKQISYTNLKESAEFSFGAASEQLLQALDQNNSSILQKANNVRQALIDSNTLPGNSEIRIQLMRFSKVFDTQTCRADKNFSSCFAFQDEYTAGNSLPTDKSTLRGQKIILLKRAPGECVTLTQKQNSQVSFDETKLLQKKFSAIFADTIYFGDYNSSNINFQIVVKRNGTVVTNYGDINCDDLVDVNFTVIPVGRLPVELFLNLDISSSMSSAITGGTTRFQAMKDQALTFLSDSAWVKNQDAIGVTQFSKVSHNGQDKTDIINGLTNNWSSANLNSLSIGGSTDSAIAESVYVSTGESPCTNSPQALTSNKARNEIANCNSTPKAKQFIILYTDGNNNAKRAVNGNTYQAALYAKSYGIIIYAIGIGPDANVADLNYLATTTGGQYWQITDKSSLDALYAVIKQKIIENAQMGTSDFNNFTLYIPLYDQNFLVYNREQMHEINDTNYLVLDFNTSNTSQTYQLKFSCLNNRSCDNNSIKIPPDDSYFNNPTNPYDKNQFTLNLRYRDIRIDLTALFKRPLLDLNSLVTNIGYQNMINIDVNFFDGNSTTPNKNMPLTFLSSAPNPLTQLVIGDNNTVKSQFNFDKSDYYLWAIIDSRKQNDCPRYNEAVLHCTEQRETQYYIINYWVWQG